MITTPSSPISPSYQSVSAPGSITPSPSSGISENQNVVSQKSPLNTAALQTKSPSRGRIVGRRVIPIVLKRRAKPAPCREIHHVDTPPPRSPQYECRPQFAFEEIQAFSQRLIKSTVKCLNAESEDKRQEEENQLYQLNKELIDSFFTIPESQNKVIQMVSESVEKELSESKKVEHIAVVKVVARLLHMVPVKESSGCHCVIM